MSSTAGFTTTCRRTRIPSEDTRARLPLREAKVEVKPVPGKSGAYNAIVWMRPWLQLEELTTSMRMVARIPQKRAVDGSAAHVGVAAVSALRPIAQAGPTGTSADVLRRARSSAMAATESVRSVRSTNARRGGRCTLGTSSIRRRRGDFLAAVAAPVASRKRRPLGPSRSGAWRSIVTWP